VTVQDGVTKRAECRCPLYKDCSRDFDPVCGSNRKTYNNECRMKVDAGKSTTTISLVKKGSCGELIFIAGS